MSGRPGSAFLRSVHRFCDLCRLTACWLCLTTTSIGRPPHCELGAPHTRTPTAGGDPKGVMASPRAAPFPRGVSCLAVTVSGACRCTRPKAPSGSSTVTAAAWRRGLPSQAAALPGVVWHPLLPPPRRRLLVARPAACLQATGCSPHLPLLWPQSARDCALHAPRLAQQQRTGLQQSPAARCRCLPARAAMAAVPVAGAPAPAAGRARTGCWLSSGVCLACSKRLPGSGQQLQRAWRL